MDESWLCTIEQIEQFLSASTLVEFSKYGNDVERYEHISRVLKRFDYRGLIVSLCVPTLCSGAREGKNVSNDLSLVAAVLMIPEGCT